MGVEGFSIRRYFYRWGGQILSVKMAAEAIYTYWHDWQASGTKMHSNIPTGIICCKLH
jgi:hypothetical protein